MVFSMNRRMGIVDIEPMTPPPLPPRKIGGKIHVSTPNLDSDEAKKLKDMCRGFQEDASFLRNMLSIYLMANSMWESDYKVMIGTTFEEKMNGNYLGLKCFILTNNNDIVITSITYNDFWTWRQQR